MEALDVNHDALFKIRKRFMIVLFSIAGLIFLNGVFGVLMPWELTTLGTNALFVGESEVLFGVIQIGHIILMVPFVLAAVCMKPGNNNLKWTLNLLVKLLIVIAIIKTLVRAMQNHWQEMIVYSAYLLIPFVVWTIIIQIFSSYTNTSVSKKKFSRVIILELIMIGVIVLVSR